MKRFSMLGRMAFVRGILSHLGCSYGLHVASASCGLPAITIGSLHICNGILRSGKFKDKNEQVGRFLPVICR